MKWKWNNEICIGRGKDSCIKRQCHPILMIIYISFPFNRKEMSGASEASSLSIPYDTSKRASLSLLRSHCLWALPTRVSVSPLNESLQDPSPMCQNNTVLISPLTKKLKKKACIISSVFTFKEFVEVGGWLGKNYMGLEL